MPVAGDHDALAGKVQRGSDYRGTCGEVHGRASSSFADRCHVSGSTRTAPHHEQNRSRPATVVLWPRGQRSGVEHINAEIKHNRGVKIVRNFTRVLGALKNHILLTFALIGANVRMLRDWHICRSMPDPWMELIGDTDDLTGPSSTRASRAAASASARSMRPTTPAEAGRPWPPDALRVAELHSTSISPAPTTVTGLVGVHAR
ncbi:hypothetical protein ACT17Q_15635 [Cellulomonas sp. CW35]|uniref:hypothetical protein n=1 Tax=Cellulomonas sp. CW35 TaxID=3458249 RepID=UPI0040345F9D